jgi:hypothetical protein
LFLRKDSNSTKSEEVWSSGVPQEAPSFDDWD